LDFGQCDLLTGSSRLCTNYVTIATLPWDFPTFFMSWWNVLILIVPLLVDPNQIHGETNCQNVSVSSLYVEGKLGGYHDDDTIPSSFQLWHKMHSMWH
jgi:hypothetical protein